MCPAFAKLDYKCRLLKEKGFIDSTWFYNGRLYIILVQGGKKTPISHMQDLYDMFDTNAIDTLVR